MGFVRNLNNFKDLIILVNDRKILILKIGELCFIVLTTGRIWDK